MSPPAVPELANPEHLPSPALLVWPSRVQANLDHMLALVQGDASRLRPHVKTHKMQEVIRMQMEAGITKFKCATIAELELCLRSGARDVLFAYPVVGPNQDRVVRLAQAYPEAVVGILADDLRVLEESGARAREGGVELGVCIDLDCGMGRTGTRDPERVVQLARLATDAKGLRFLGLHAYDGHVRATPVEEREVEWDRAMKEVQGFVDLLARERVVVPAVVGGGSPTFGLHAARRGWECSPGTTLFWDGGYGSLFPDLPFVVAAAVLTRIISKPAGNRLCLDLGHKAIASEGPLEKRVRLLGLEDATPIMHSEEHLVLEHAEAERFEVGQAFLGIPHHICPTVALHQEAILVRGGHADGEAWPVAARDRRITI